jgi:hypothetical protein
MEKYYVIKKGNQCLHICCFKESGYKMLRNMTCKYPLPNVNCRSWWQNILCVIIDVDSKIIQQITAVNLPGNYISNVERNTM